MSAEERVVQLLEELVDLYRRECEDLRSQVQCLKEEVHLAQEQEKQVRLQLQEQLRINAELRRVPVRKITVDANGMQVHNGSIKSEDPVLVFCYLSVEEQAALRKVPLTNLQKIQEAMRLAPLLNSITSVAPLQGKGRLYQASVSFSERQQFMAEIAPLPIREALRKLLVARFVTQEIPAEIAK